MDAPSSRAMGACWQRWKNVYRSSADPTDPPRGTLSVSSRFFSPDTTSVSGSCLPLCPSDFPPSLIYAMSSSEVAPDAKVSKGIDPAHIEKHGAFEEDGGIHDRPAMERKLLWKLDMRFSILIIM